MSNTAYLLVNFGGPRHLEEIEEFLQELLTDKEVIRTPFPLFLHRYLFSKVAKKRSSKIAPDYALIGGKSPIYEDTEEIARKVGERLGKEVLTFHRYLPKTHSLFLEKIESVREQEIRIFPMFPQFSYATTGSIALWFAQHLKPKTVQKMSWIRSYPSHPQYLQAMQQCLREFLITHQIKEEETFLLFSAHGLPQKFICSGDIYEQECRLTFKALKERFPSAHSILSYQSQFGKEEWIRPYTVDVCKNIKEYSQGRQKGVIVPLSFSSDHIETLYEIEYQYVPMIRKQEIEIHRCPALNQRQDWIETITTLFQQNERVSNQTLLRR